MFTPYLSDDICYSERRTGRFASGKGFYRFYLAYSYKSAFVLSFLPFFSLRTFKLFLFNSFFVSFVFPCSYKMLLQISLQPGAAACCDIAMFPRGVVGWVPGKSAKRRDWLGTSASLLGTSALLVVTRSY